MKAEYLTGLIEAGGTDFARKYLKKQPIPQRMELLKEVFHTVNGSPKRLKFYRDNFAIELGALSKGEMNCDKAVELYRRAKGK